MAMFVFCILNGVYFKMVPYFLYTSHAELRWCECVLNLKPIVLHRYRDQQQLYTVQGSGRSLFSEPYKTT
jgi:hypothetical protein